MINAKGNPKHERAGFSASSRFGGLDQLDWLMILLSVLIGTIAKQHHFLQLPAGFLEWILPFLLIMAGYKARGKIAEIIDGRRATARNTQDE
jgi:hypothetical protein